jgi:hypothetical protein
MKDRLLRQEYVYREVHVHEAFARIQAILSPSFDMLSGLVVWVFPLLPPAQSHSKRKLSQGIQVPDKRRLINSYDLRTKYLR